MGWLKRQEVRKERDMSEHRTIGAESMLTAQEFAFAGGTPQIIPKDLGSKDWYIPQGILTGVFTPQEIQTARGEKGYRSLGLIGSALGVKRENGEVVGFALSDIDPDTGITKEDPQLMVGVWDEGTRKIVGSDLTNDLVELFEGMPEEERVDLHLRKESRDPEREGGGSPERG